MSKSSNDPFEERIKKWRSTAPSEVIDGAIYVHDTLELSFAAAQSIFGEEVHPDVALRIYDRIENKIGQLSEPSDTK